MILFNDRIEIDPQQPLPEYDTAFAKAYAARTRATTATTPMMALICTSLLPVRGELVASLRGFNHPGLIQVRDFGPVSWPLTNTRAQAFIYERPAGQRMAAHQSVFTPRREENFVTSFVKPMASALAELGRMSIFHGAIRVDNIFIEEGENGAAMLGDCVAMPVSFGQPVVYETIERGLAGDIARGVGGPGDDLYALGVAITIALTGGTPLKDLRDDAIVQLKMERGSYIALLGERRFGAALTELLRGLLADEPKQRWSHADVSLWLEGRRQTPKQSIAARKASRPLRFNNQEFLQPRQLAAALAHDTKHAAQMVKNEEIVRWLSHGLGDENAVKYFNEAQVAVKRMRTGSDDDRMAAMAIMALDPHGPIRYRGVTLFPTGFPAVLADGMLRDTQVQILAEILQNDFAGQWLTTQTEKRPDLVATTQMLERAREHLEKPQSGFGLERVLYEINPGLPCLSPIIRDQYALTLRGLLEALDARAPNGTLIDRHVAAYILARDRKALPQVLRAIDNAKSSGERGVCVLTLYSDMQYRLGPDRLPGLSQALLPMTEDAVRRFKNRNRQEKVRKELKAASATGNLGDMLKLVDDPALIALDEQEYAAARLLYQETENEVQRMSAYARNKKALAIEAGEPLAAVMAVAIGFVLLCIIVLRVLA